MRSAGVRAWEAPVFGSLGRAAAGLVLFVVLHTDVRSLAADVRRDRAGIWLCAFRVYHCVAQMSVIGATLDIPVAVAVVISVFHPRRHPAGERVLSARHRQRHRRHRHGARRCSCSIGVTCLILTCTHYPRGLDNLTDREHPWTFPRRSARRTTARRALYDGDVRVEGVALRYLRTGVEELFWRQGRYAEFDAAEFSAGRLPGRGRGPGAWPTGFPLLLGDGKVLLAALPREESAALIRTQLLEAWTPRTITSVPLLEAALERVRADGYALNDEETALGLRSLAGAILDAVGLLAGRPR